jgi:hypothetical protein
MAEEQKNNNQGLEKEYPEFVEFFKEVPQAVIDFVLSEETADKIADICINNGVSDGKRIEEISYRTIFVISGRLSKEKLSMVIENDVKLDTKTAEKIANEINEFISPFIAQPNTEITAQPKTNGLAQTEKEPQKEEIIKEEPKRPRKPDVYHEPIE